MLSSISVYGGDACVCVGVCVCVCADSDSIPRIYYMFKLCIIAAYYAWLWMYSDLLHGGGCRTCTAYLPITPTLNRY